jgi:TPR repeat protein
MTGQPSKLPIATPNPQMIWVAGFAAIAIIASVFGTQYIQKPAPVTADTKLEQAIEAVRSGSDQTALSTLTPLATGGNSKAQYWLADIYENGLGVSPDAVKAVGLLGKSAEQGYVPAEQRLGELYLQGDKTLQDFGQAELWLHKAAVAGNGTAQREVGRIYDLGLGVARDPSMAYGWYENAALHGDGLATSMRDDILKQMAPADVAKGEQDAKAIGVDIKPVAS